MCREDKRGSASKGRGRDDRGSAAASSETEAERRLMRERDDEAKRIRADEDAYRSRRADWEKHERCEPCPALAIHLWRVSMNVQPIGQLLDHLGFCE